MNGSLVLLKTTPGSEMSAEVAAPASGVCVGVDPRIPPDVVVGCTGTDGPVYAVSAVKDGVESPTSRRGYAMHRRGPAYPARHLGMGGILGKIQRGAHLAVMALYLA